MKFVNRTDEQADALWGVAGLHEMGASVIVKGTYEVDEQGGLTRATEAPWPIQRENLETPWGLFFADLMPVGKPRTDLIVCGTARSHLGRPVEQMDVVVWVGSDRRMVVRVIGDRRWERRRRHLVPSRPEPFVELPLTMERAYGGVVTIEWGDLPSQDNRQGRGFYLEESQAEGNPLPNLEDPARLIERWDDRPDPLAPCVFPPDSAVRARLIPEGEDVAKFDHLFLNQAHPRLMLEQTPAPGEALRVDGVRHEGPFLARVAPCPARAWVRCDDEVTPITLRLDTIILLIDEGRAVFRWRGGTRFHISPRQHREVVLAAA